MKAALFAAAVSLTIACAVLAAGNPKTSLNLIDSFDKLVQTRFADPQPAALGMSRVAIPNSFGAHFMPLPSMPADFRPNNAVEQELIADLASHRLQAGFYVFG